MTPVLVLTTWPADRDAADVARTLVEERLAACVAVGAPLQSIYRWQGAVEQAEERPLTIKTTDGRLAALEARLTALHPYDVPEFLVVPVTGGSAAYLSWMAESTVE
jgi:periplasmic divalent cation tolerance protein